MKTLNRQRNPLVRSCNNGASLLHHSMTTLNYSHGGHLMAGIPTRERRQTSTISASNISNCHRRSLHEALNIDPEIWTVLIRRQIFIDIYAWIMAIIESSVTFYSSGASWLFARHGYFFTTCTVTTCLRSSLLRKTRLICINYTCPFIGFLTPQTNKTLNIVYLWRGCRVV